MSVRVTIGILSWNREDALKVALQSVQKQTIFSESEVLIVDNCSVDGTREMLRAEFPWVRLIERETNSGLAEGRNIIVRMARAPIVFWMDDDCELVENDCLERLVAETERNPEYLIVFARIIEAHDGWPHVFPPADVQPEAFQMQESLPSTFASGGTCVRKKQFLEIGGYDSDFFRMSVEHALSYRAFGAGLLIRYLPHVTIIHRPHRFGRNDRIITKYSARNKLLGIARYLPWKIAVPVAFLDTIGYLRHAVRRPAAFVGLVQGILGFLWRLPRCCWRERAPIGANGVSRWAHARHYIIRHPQEYQGVPSRYPFLRFLAMELRTRVLRYLGWSRDRPFLPKDVQSDTVGKLSSLDPEGGEVACDPTVDCIP